MAHNHTNHCSEHHHHGRSLQDNRRALKIALAVTGLIMIVEVAGGIFSNSLALLSDAGHMLTDLLALVLSFLALSYASRPPTSTKTYGFYRLEILAALTNGVILILISLYIFWEAYKRLITPVDVKGQIMLYVALVGLVANLIAAVAMQRVSRDSLNIRSAFLHILGDALSSVGVIVAALIIKWTDLMIIDPIISFVISVVILFGAYQLVRDSANILLEAAPKEINPKELMQTLLTLDEVQEIHCLHIWAITSGVYALSAHVRVSDMAISSSLTLLEKIQNTLRDDFHINHTTIQFESKPGCEEELNCVQGQNCMRVFNHQG
ncbi:MAG TPA: cation diffusion facilitator family transporter [Thermodesulfovibrionia bacterium]|nr:cation diffusion facilitator family transporter [Thermodesulfovibrionia bacterium]